MLDDAEAWWQKHIVDIANLDNLQVVVFQHGEPFAQAGRWRCWPRGWC